MATAIYAFDAYGTLFDVHAAASRERDAIGAHWERLSQVWRTKHLEYSWIHGVALTMASARPTFWELAAQSLDYAIATTGPVPPDVRTRLLAAYRSMAAFPEVPAALQRLKAGGAQLCILSNGDPDMLADAVSAAGLNGMFHAVLSVTEAATFKPQAAVYQLVTRRFSCAPADVTFFSSNRWDVAAGKAFGFRCVWVNRSGAPNEYPSLHPDQTARDLTSL